MSPINSALPAFPAATIIGYPRIGPNRELKKALESYWKAGISRDQLETAARELRHSDYARLTALGLDPQASAIPASFSYYDQVLDTAVAVGAVPARFRDLYDDGGRLDLDGAFTLARGDRDRSPLEMTKWFDTNYHYLVPELGPDALFRADVDGLVRSFTEDRAAGYLTRPVLVGPVSLLLLSKPADGAPAGFSPLTLLPRLLPVYAQILRRLKAAGAEWVQLDEPALVADQPLAAGELAAAVRETYRVLAGELTPADRPQILVTSAYGSLAELLPVLAQSPVEALHLDVFKGEVPPAADLGELGSTVLVAGLVDGHNVWWADLAEAAERLALLQRSAGTVSVATSTSLFHVPYDVSVETALDPAVRSWLAFADQKVAEVLLLARAAASPGSVDTDIEASRQARLARSSHPGVNLPGIRSRTARLGAADFSRPGYNLRREAQESALGLPLLPTTTIGSFPQTTEVRQARARVRRGDISAAEYREAMEAEIGRVIRLQEELGFDVLVHGEPERNDMVQYFAENLDGFAVTEHGWVQSYGSRCTRPSILWGDVSRPAPITVPWTSYAQSLTIRPVKGMLTGPVTILAWSFVRDDQPLAQTANQVALALRDEIADLEAAGTGIIQVDEPALRELLPLRASGHAAYLAWSVDSFRLATAGARAATQIHTHLCYSEFGAVIGAIDALDADVTSIEAARSRMEVITDLEAHGFSRGIGPGIYDIHSPRIPSREELAELLTKATRSVAAGQLWVNPDCGLKTRGYAETTESLRNLVAAARQVRQDLPISVS